MSSWLQQLMWSKPHSITQLTTGADGRTVIPKERGYYAFVEGHNVPVPNRCLYVGIALGKTGLYGRLGSYLRTDVSLAKAKTMKHAGKRLLSFARIRGVDTLGTAKKNTAHNDSFIHVCWAPAPFNFESESKGKNEREVAYMLERAMIDYYRPIYNTANYDRYNDFDLEDDAFDGDIPW